MTGFRQDDEGDWVAELSCLHAQHVRHQPPFSEAPWVNDAHERQARVGRLLECPLCDRAELPDGLRPVRTTVTWDEQTMPLALRGAHRIAPGTWGLIEVETGALRFVAATTPTLETMVTPERSQAIPPEVDHRVEPIAPVRFHVTFLTR